MKVVIAIAVSVCSLYAGSARAADVLTTARAIHHLSEDQAKARPAAHLHATVTAAMPEWRGISIQDATDGLYVSLWRARLPMPKVGDVVDITGAAGPGAYAPMVEAHSIRVVGSAPMPKPHEVDWRLLSSGACDNQYVSFSGIVRSVNHVAPPAWLWPATAIHVDLGGNTSWAYVRDGGSLDSEIQPDARVAVDGVCVVLANRRGQFEQNVLFIPDTKAIHVLQPAPADPFSAPLRDVLHLFAYSPDSTGLTHRVRVRGTITFADDHRVFLQAGPQGLLVETIAPVQVHLGNLGEAVGFPGPGEFSTKLMEASVRSLGKAPPLKPAVLHAHDVIRAALGNSDLLPDGLLTQFTGTIVETTRSAKEEMLIVQDGGDTFPVRVPRSAASHAVGSEVRLTGICVLQVNPLGLARSFELLLRSPADVVVLKGPPLLTRSLAVRAAAVLLALFAISAVWLALLRRRVRTQAEVIRLQRDMAENQERFRTLADNIPQLAWMAEPDGQIFWHNQRWCEYTGALAEESEGWNWKQWYHPQHAERVLASLRHSFETGQKWQDTMPLRGANGEYRWFLGQAMPIRDPRGIVVRWFGTYTDITDRKRMEADLQRSNADLQQFAYIASHDLQEPLRNVCLYSQLLSRTYGAGELTQEREEILGIINAAAHRMQRLVMDLLAYSRVSLTPQKPVETVDLEVALDSALTNLSASIAESQARIVHDPLPSVAASHMQMSQLMQNLIGNSIKYRRLDVPLEVHLSVQKNSEKWVFCVQDNGAGFDPKYAKNVFGIFKRLHGPDVPGTGIGLALCKTIVERHGGEIWAEAQPGEGAKFYFTLPQNG